MDTSSLQSMSADDWVTAGQTAGDDDSAVQRESCHEAYDDGVLRITRSGNPPVLAIAGEIDESTYPGLAAALEKLVGGQAEVRVSLVDVRYCDLAGLRTIVRLAGGGGGHDGRGRRLVLHDIPPDLTNVLRIMGWDMTPGLVIDVPRPGPHGLPG